ncbi:unnamed protein product [Prorocentrum cordatum]|uniref:Protein xylosyltransferase n=1 Tax=Prorocentrum cordatum TaxID=2364126 RepID=A0ABN9YAL9_9DINO|nr:unnamed protein product [Polarella glacialis]
MRSSGPCPKANKRVGEADSLDHLRPEGWWDYNFIEEDFPLPSNENGTHPRPSTTPTGPFGFHLYNRSILVPNCWATVYEVLRFVAQCRLDGPTRFKSLENISWDVYSTDDSHMQAVLSKFTRRVEGGFRFLEDALLASRTESSIEGQVLISNNGFRQEHHKSVEYVLNHTLQDQDLLSMEAILGSTRKIEASQKSIPAVQNSTVQHSTDEKVHNDIDHGMQIGGEDDGPRFGDILLIYNEDPDFTRAVLEHAVLFVDQTIVFEKAGTGRLNPYRLINLKTVLREWPPANVGAKTGIFSWHLHRVWSWEDRPLLRNLSEGDFVKQFSLSGSPVDRRWPMLWQWPAEDRRQYTLGVGDDPRSRTGEVDEIVLLQARRYGLCRSRARPRLVPCAGRREAGGPPNADGPREGHPAQSEWGQEARDLDDSWFRSVPVFV